ncbi:hypothetical protein [Vibrio agarivorans]|uniref:hypothetical protein n=1 Tax=Vibrio agarivorans TaxID=153622 RepID=UPI00222EB3C8|nr:hypothetical protein [Vibrio agarivorans]
MRHRRSQAAKSRLVVFQVIFRNLFGKVLLNGRLKVEHKENGIGPQYRVVIKN